MIIWQKKGYRIIEVGDNKYSLHALKGDLYCPESNPDVPLDVLAAQEAEFERLVAEEGVFGYVLERWDGEIDQGWVEVESCYGFMGRYDRTNEDYDHYIVEELKLLAAL